MLGERKSKSILLFGAFFSIFALLGISIDIIVGSFNGGGLLKLSQTAVDRFNELHSNTVLGLYNLDLLNIIIQILLIPSYFALFFAQRGRDFAFSLFAFVLFTFGTSIMVSANVALSMLELSEKYFNTNNESQRLLYSAAGEALLAQGKHGSPSVFLGFFIPTLANVLMSIVMLKSKVFGKLNAWIGIVGSVFMLIYIILINFNFGIKNVAVFLAMPGGLLLMLWMLLYTIRLFKLSV
ncbi:hypothetical protein CH352_11915 [Leptospira hartskeerlii]|uniref:DUF4386 domain-containing protein n=1 Tax=Leptospira hartskeerlii TaxID=2023177 RepID=A0A2M9XB21_9LEPT|nr:hypothetical protein [Leptospira hartskeerlii]PJZ24876.1 hypothetical protein CH357_14965 [Leptospira hartskeerlii]PJZ33032.1 hypothetical protein CH352_11915 [Leptospira hartskeerlii]